jgi:very-short-patch-repair endonuclease
LADDQSQSALESMSRWLFHARKLPMPEIQVLIGDDTDPFALADFYWREAGVIGEADGLLKYDGSPDALRKEKLRQERLERLGFIVVRWTFDDLMNRPNEVVARVRDAIQRGLRKRSGTT